jgi:hypothetical protein
MPFLAAPCSGAECPLHRRRDDCKPCFGKKVTLLQPTDLTEELLLRDAVIQCMFGVEQ